MFNRRFFENFILERRSSGIISLGAALNTFGLPRLLKGMLFHASTKNLPSYARDALFATNLTPRGLYISSEESALAPDTCGTMVQSLKSREGLGKRPFGLILSKDGVRTSSSMTRLSSRVFSATRNDSDHFSILQDEEKAQTVNEVVKKVFYTILQDKK